ncbi:hypothetical protein PHSC3_000814 [Chlamydiales bacterium STE3]|nr:hypothetical protein PHSC3_000814 [Chlamydiales bacterium STE3]
MKFCQILLLMLALLFGACSTIRHNAEFPVCPELSCINLVDREGLTEMIRTPDRLRQYEGVDYLKPQPYQKIMRVFNRDAQGNVSAIITLYHPNGYPKQYLEVLNNQASGCYREWYANGILKVEGHIISGSPDINTAAEKTWLFDGVTSAWDENGTLIAKIEYTKGGLSGTSTYFHANGTIWKTIPYELNRVHGPLCIYLENGELLHQTEYQNGLKSGPSIRYWKKNQIASKELFLKGRLINGEYFDLKGDLVAQIEKGTGYRATFGKDSINELQEYKDGLLEGEVLVFSSNGQLARVYYMKNDLKHGEETLFYPQKQPGAEVCPKMSITWHQGKIQGVVKTWYDNGTMESQRVLSENEKNGLSTAWYRDGNLMLIEEYDEGKLVRGDYYPKKERQPVSQVLEGKGTATLFDSEGNFLRKINYIHGKPEI